MNQSIVNIITTKLQDPENREIVNEGQDVFIVTYHESRGIEFEFRLLDYGAHHFDWYDSFDGYGMFIIRHCIATLPCFDVETESSKSTHKMLNTQYKKYGSNGCPECGSDFSWHTLQTLRQALLSAPVLTVEQLEEYAAENKLLDSIQ